MRGALLAVALAACAGEQAPPPPEKCNAAQRSGTYMFTYAEYDEGAPGTCGPVEAHLVTLDPDAGPGPNCTVRADLWSERACKLERDVICHVLVEQPGTWGGYGDVRNHTVAVTRQMTDDGSRIEGTFTVTLDDGRRSCKSTYKVTAVRQ
jgi:hypothetical protein